MAITFKEFQSKAEQVEAHPESSKRPWIFPLTGLAEEVGKFSKTLEAELPKGTLATEEREKIIENAWPLLWHLSAACGFAGIPLEEVAERGMVGLDKIGDSFLPG
ncbi:MAG: hypothetical protein ABSH15_17305 [Verrucomicrobiota bacterium]|jgi:hypothetical protein